MTTTTHNWYGVIKLNKLLVIYNTCGIKYEGNADWYIECIDNILKQDFDDYHVVLSSCLNTDSDFNKIYNEFKNRISYNRINEIFTVNTTFNHTIQQCVKQFGQFDGYLYLDSGINYQNQTNILQESYELLKTGKYGMVYVATDTDNAFKTTNINIDFPTNEHFILPIGVGLNAHNVIYSKELYEAYDNRVWVDIFASTCSESVFTFVCAGINKEIVLHKNLVVHHKNGIDCPSAGFITPINNMYFHCIPKTNLHKILSNPEAYACGLGYEECNRILMHNPELYNGNQCKNPYRLKEFIRKNLFVDRSIIDYGNIEHDFTPGNYK